MANEHPFSDEPASAGGAASESAADAARRAERKARAKLRNAAETARDRAETARERVDAARESLGERAQSWAEEARAQGSSAARAAGDRYARATRNAAERVGSAVGRARSLRTEDIITEVKRFVGRHPSSLLGAAAAGFLLGRKMRGR